MSAIELCRTAALGGHLEQCDSCGHQRPAYNSAAIATAPSASPWPAPSGSKTAKPNSSHRILPRGLHRAGRDCRHRLSEQGSGLRHSLPRRRRDLTHHRRRSQHLGAEIGFLAVLHSWGQNLLLHPHLHCVVPGGGIGPDGQRWVACRPGFFLPVRVLSCLFRRLFLEYLQTAFDPGQLQFFSSLERLRDRRAFAQYLAPLRKTEWVVYAKRPFGGPEQVLNYLGRYTHRVAISNNRLLDIEDGKVSFHWKDYRHDDQQKTMTLEADEFIRRFLLHVLPDGFQRIRHYGFLGHRYRQAKLALCRQLLGMPSRGAGRQQKPQGLSRPLRRTHRHSPCVNARSAIRAHGDR